MAREYYGSEVYFGRKIVSGVPIDYGPAIAEEFPTTPIYDEPLCDAIRYRDYEAARHYLMYGANPNRVYFFGTLINAICDAEYIELLLSFGAFPDMRDETGMTPLMRAVRNKAMDVALLLIVYGADVNAMTDARHYYRTVMHYAVLSASHKMVRLLIRHGASLHYQSERWGRPNPLQVAVAKADLEMVRMLLDAGADPNDSCTAMGSPLHAAGYVNILDRKAKIQMLLECGADPNLQILNDYEGENNRRFMYVQICRHWHSPLVEYMAYIGQPDESIIRLLLRHGVRVTMNRDPDGLLGCFHGYTDEDIFYLLLDAAEAFDVTAIRRLANLTTAQREILIHRATNPNSLLGTCRVYLRKFFRAHIPYAVNKLDIPETLRRYLVFD